MHTDPLSMSAASYLCHLMLTCAHAGDSTHSSGQTVKVVLTAAPQYLDQIFLQARSNVRHDTRLYYCFG